MIARFSFDNIIFISTTAQHDNDNFVRFQYSTTMMDELYHRATILQCCIIVYCYSRIVLVVDCHLMKTLHKSYTNLPKERYLWQDSGLDFRDIIWSESDLMIVRRAAMITRPISHNLSVEMDLLRWLLPSGKSQNHRS